ncbi:MAG: ABC transporter permease [Oscillospiraceae bacterium]
MYSKLSFRNMKRSIADYAIYFVTLMLAVCIFYVFNSISAQTVLLDLSAVQSETMKYLGQMITMASIIISIIFCILCVFANQFLIKRRKKEFGLYMSLGMSRLGVSSILVMETLLIGVVSLVVGIGVGVLASQGMSAFTSSLFNIAITKYQFISSFDAMLKTILMFGIVFGLVMIFNVVAVSKYTLIDLLKSEHKISIKNPKNFVLDSVLAILSIVVTGAGYYVLLSTDTSKGYSGIAISILLMIVGTIVFYCFGIPTILSFFRRNKKVSYKKINLFTIQQMRSKASNIAVTMSITSLLIFFTISILTNGISYKKTMENELKLVAPFDASVSIFNDERVKDIPTEKLLKEAGIDTSGQNNAIVNVYDPLLDVYQLLTPYAVGTIEANLKEGILSPLTAIKYSEYQKLMKLQGKESIVVGEGETLIITNMNEAQESIKKLTDSIGTFEIGNKTLTLVSEKYQLAAIETETTGRTIACFVIPDNVANELESYLTIVNIQNSKNDDSFVGKYEETFSKIATVGSNLSDDRFYIKGITKVSAVEEITGNTTNLLYVGVYLGIVFLIACGAVIGLRLLSDASDEKNRYQIIRRIGANEKIINKSVFAQVSSYFGLPLIFALPNAIIVSIFVTKQISVTASATPIIPALVTAGMLALLYGGYFLITLSGYKRIINK